MRRGGGGDGPAYLFTVYFMPGGGKSLRKAFSPANDNRDIFLHKNHFLLLGWYILAENTTAGGAGIETFYLLPFKFCSNLRIEKMKTCVVSVSK